MKRAANKTVVKADLVNAIHNEVGLSKVESAEFVDAILGKIETALISDQTVKLAGFGNFLTLNKSERIGRNPMTGKPVMITPRRIVTFRPSPRFSERVTKGIVRRSGRKDGLCADSIK